MKEPDPSRRRFLARIVVAVSAVVAALVATPAVAYLLSPLLRLRSNQWVAIGDVSTFARPAPQRITYEYDERNGYTVERTRRVVFVAWDGDELIVLSPVCTHLGCNVTFDNATNLFECPCHGGRYDAAGRVVEGPPPQPLRRLQTRDRDGILEVEVT